eukprot:Skav230069  [mRNA]  locus=scaffold2569:51412:55052:+ [translate_table: standard]
MALPEDLWIFTGASRQPGVSLPVDLPMGMGPDGGDTAVAEKAHGLDVLFAKAALMPGVERLIRHLHRRHGGEGWDVSPITWASRDLMASPWASHGRHGIPMAVATSSHRRHFDLKTTLHKELFSLMTHIVTGDQAPVARRFPIGTWVSALALQRDSKLGRFCFKDVDFMSSSCDIK